MDEETREYSDNFIDEHWEYIRDVLIASYYSLDEPKCPEKEDKIMEIGFHYKTALKHGFKHGYEYAITKGLTV